MPDQDRVPDDFWNVEDLLPRKIGSKVSLSQASRPEAVEIELPVPSDRESSPAREANEDSKQVCDTPLTVEHPAGNSARNSSITHYVSEQGTMGDTEIPLVDYEPDSALLHRVTVYGWEGNYHYFDSFADDAVRYDAMRPVESASPVPFFSYFPQYVQLGRRSTAWYLYWREGVRRGIYADTDYAYILLYLFELINLPADEPAVARTNRDLMANVWMAYRRAHPRLDHYMCEWLCDYCLIHRLDAPVDLLAPALDDIITESRLKEFYLSAAVRVPTDGSGESAMGIETARILMRHCCQYDYRKSKFASGEHKELFDRTIPAAIASALPMLLGAGGRKPVIEMLDSTLVRDAYTGALCSYRNKRRVRVAYTSFSRAHELRFLMGDMVKHVENRLRGWIGVRSKLSVMSLPIPLRDALDAYLNPLAPPKSALPTKKKEAPRPSYEALYDLPTKPVSLADASAIEADSWETTRILVEAFEEHAAGEAPSQISAPPEMIFPEMQSSVPVLETEKLTTPLDSCTSSALDGVDTTSPLAPYFPFIRAALREDASAQKQAASGLRKMPDAVADEINALTADGEIGDVILEENGCGVYTVVEDYREWVQAATEGRE